MNNEPVAWAMFKGDTFMDAIHPDEHKRFEGGYTIPLYTHPVKELILTHEEYDNIFANGKRLGVIETENRLWKAMQLTDEEIKTEMGCVSSSYPTVECLIDFARAILRKASEK